MNIRLTYKLAKIFTVAQVRSNIQKGKSINFTRKPLIILIIDFIALAAALLLTNLFVTALSSEGLESTLKSLTLQSLTGLPVIILSFFLLLGLIWEISQSYVAAHSDILNWLPISPTEYVTASSISTVYTYSPILALGLGVTLPFALYTGLSEIWVISAIMSALSMFLGSFTIELLRAAMNRVSSVFFKRAGRSATIFRLLALVLVLGIAQLMFNPNIMIILMPGLVGGVNAAWFLPVSWPSLTIMSAYEAQVINTTSYGLLTIVFAGVLFLIGVKLRAKFWVPISVSMKVTSYSYAPKTGFLEKIGFSRAESAIIKKDFKSLIRRREMARFLTFPIIVPLAIILPSLASPTSTNQFYTVIYSVLLGVLMFTFFLATISIGQEGCAVWTLYASPITPRELVRAKAGLILIISLSIMLLIGLGLCLALISKIDTVSLFLIAALSVIIEETFVGLAVGTAFPDFTEIPRSRFTTLKGYLIGMLVGTVAAVITMTPLLAYLLFSGSVSSLSYLSITLSSTLIIVGITSFIAYKISIANVSKLFKEMRI
jgi:hypothetical protein